MTQALIQTTIGKPGNFALVGLKDLNGPKLMLYNRDNTTSGGQRWNPGPTATPSDAFISGGATSSGAIIQSTIGTPDKPGSFEVLVLEANKQLMHYDKDAHESPWLGQPTVVSREATGPASFIQSSFGTPQFDGNFEAVVLEGSNLVHYYRDNSKDDHPWHRTVVITSKATGPGSIIQSSYGTPNHPGNFEVIVPEGGNLVHYYRDNSANGYPWHYVTTITSKATGPGCLIQSTFGTPCLGNFEVVVLEGTELVHYWRDNSDVKQPWHKTVAITTGATHSGSLIQSNYGTPYAPGNFEVVVLEGHDLVHYWRDNTPGSGFPWHKTIIVANNMLG